MSPVFPIIYVKFLINSQIERVFDYIKYLAKSAFPFLYLQNIHHFMEKFQYISWNFNFVEILRIELSNVAEAQFIVDQKGINAPIVNTYSPKTTTNAESVLQAEQWLWFKFMRGIQKKIKSIFPKKL
jgi:hypothetical protein